ncbi:putative serine/arginine repetitive matrix protein 2 [Blattamonas nauphoetae]|uniref:Serine/arginine repetitive matrix protein 2 n=1 Tax=Blattamonas nauphoetae TaxID=2049346 RepID=A0ABQ9X664_9EUKA|nr:putative serine/arginine repetitive matrix protein 2 [Blattamonas nauphoetae]
MIEMLIEDLQESTSDTGGYIDENEHKDRIEIIEIFEGVNPSDDLIVTCARDNMMKITTVVGFSLRVSLLPPDKSSLEGDNDETPEPSDIRKTRRYVELHQQYKEQRDQEHADFEMNARKELGREVPISANKATEQLLSQPVGVVSFGKHSTHPELSLEHTIPFSCPPHHPSEPLVSPQRPLPPAPLPNHPFYDNTIFRQTSSSPIRQSWAGESPVHDEPRQIEHITPHHSPQFIRHSSSTTSISSQYDSSSRLKKEDSEFHFDSPILQPSESKSPPILDKRYPSLGSTYRSTSRSRTPLKSPRRSTLSSRYNTARSSSPLSKRKSSKKTRGGMSVELQKKLDLMNDKNKIEDPHNIKPFRPPFHSVLTARTRRMLQKAGQPLPITLDDVIAPPTSRERLLARLKKEPNTERVWPMDTTAISMENLVDLDAIEDNEMTQQEAELWILKRNSKKERTNKLALPNVKFRPPVSSWKKSITNIQDPLEELSEYRTRDKGIFGSNRQSQADTDSDLPNRKERNPPKSPSASFSTHFSSSVPVQPINPSQQFLKKGQWVLALLPLPSLNLFLCSTSSFALILYSLSDFRERGRYATRTLLTSLSLAPTSAAKTFKDVIEQNMIESTSERQRRAEREEEEESSKHCIDPRSPLYRSPFQASQMESMSHIYSSRVLDFVSEHDSTLILAGDVDGNVHLLQPLCPQGPRQFVSKTKLHKERVNGIVVLSTDQFASCSLDGSIVFVDMRYSAWGVVRKIQLPVKQNVPSSFPIPSSSFIAVGAGRHLDVSQLSTIPLPSLANTQPLTSSQIDKNRTSSISVATPQEQLVEKKLNQVGFVHLVSFRAKSLIIASTTETSIYIFNYLNGSLIACLEGHTAPILRSFVDEQRELLISVAENKEIRLWSMRDFRLIQSITDQMSKEVNRNMFVSCAYSKRRSLLLTASDIVKAWNIDIRADDDERRKKIEAQRNADRAEALKRAQTIVQPLSPPSCVQTNPSFISPQTSPRNLGISGQLQVLSPKTPEKTKTMTLFEMRNAVPLHVRMDGVLIVLVSHVFSEVISITSSLVVNVFSLDTNLPVFSFPITISSRLLTAKLDHFQRSLIVAEVDGKVQFWNFHSGECVLKVPPVPTRIGVKMAAIREEKRKENERLEREREKERREDQGQDWVRDQDVSFHTPRTTRSRAILPNSPSRRSISAGRTSRSRRPSTTRTPSDLSTTPRTGLRTAQPQRRSSQMSIELPILSSRPASTGRHSHTPHATRVSSFPDRGANPGMVKKPEPAECTAICVPPFWHASSFVASFFSGIMLNASLSLFNDYSHSLSDNTISIRDLEPFWDELETRAHQGRDLVDVVVCSKYSGACSFLFGRKEEANAKFAMQDVCVSLDVGGGLLLWHLPLTHRPSHTFDIIPLLLEDDTFTHAVLEPLRAADVVAKKSARGAGDETMWLSTPTKPNWNDQPQNSSTPHVRSSHAPVVTSPTLQGTPSGHIGVLQSQRSFVSIHKAPATNPKTHQKKVVFSPIGQTPGSAGGQKDETEERKERERDGFDETLTLSMLAPFVFHKMVTCPCLNLVIIVESHTAVSPHSPRNPPLSSHSSSSHNDSPSFDPVLDISHNSLQHAIHLFSIHSQSFVGHFLIPGVLEEIAVDSRGRRMVIAYGGVEIESKSEAVVLNRGRDKRKKEGEDKGKEILRPKRKPKVVLELFDITNWPVEMQSVKKWGMAEGLSEQLMAEMDSNDFVLLDRRTDERKKRPTSHHTTNISTPLFMTQPSPNSSPLQTPDPHNNTNTFTFVGSELASPPSSLPVPRSQSFESTPTSLCSRQEVDVYFPATITSLAFASAEVEGKEVFVVGDSDGIVCVLSGENGDLVNVVGVVEGDEQTDMRSRMDYSERRERMKKDWEERYSQFVGKCPALWQPDP